jgi:uncharacterized protein
MTEAELAELRRRLHVDGRLVLQLRIIPKSPRTAWAGMLDDASIKVRVAAAPEKGKANAELVRFLAREFGVPAQSVEIVTGSASSRKQVRLSARE